MSIRTALMFVALAATSQLVACKSDATTSSPAAKTSGPTDSTRVSISVTEKGFEPDKVAVKKGVATTLVFTRKTDATCAKAVVIPVGDHKITKDLPLDQPVEIAVMFPNAGEVQYACSMDMEHGVLTVQ